MKKNTLKKILPLVLLLFCLTTSTYSQNRQKIIGLFAKCVNDNYQCDQIELKSDWIVIYGMSNGDCGIRYFKGKWSNVKDTIFIKIPKPYTENDITNFCDADFSFVYEDFITDLKLVLIKKKLYYLNPENNVIVKDKFLKRTSTRKTIGRKDIQ